MLNLLIFAVLLPLNLLAAESKVYYEARPIQKIDDSFQSFRHGRAKVLLFEKDGQILAGNIGDIPTKFKHIGGVDGKLTYLHKAKSQWNETWHTQIVLDKNRQSFEYKGWCDADWCEKNPQV